MGRLALLLTSNNKSSSDMKEKIENILIKVDEGTMPVQQALNELLLLFSVSKSVCNCKICGKETDYDLINKLCPNCW